MNQARSQRGQTLPIITLFMFAMLGMCALAIDVGSWYQQKRSLQSAADAGALAGAAYLPVSWAAANTAAAGEYAKNASGDTVSYQASTQFVANDSITVTASRPASSFFAQVFGHGSITVKATAQATVVQSDGGALPWGIMKGTYTPGSTYTIYTNFKGSPNNGAIRLPAWDSSSASCVDSGGSSLYRDELSGTAAACMLALDQVVKTDTGQNAGPTTQGIGSRCGSLQPAGSIVSFGGMGQVTLIQPASCQLVLLPLVEDASNGAAVWPTQGSAAVRVIGFSWWVISNVYQQGSRVDAVYVGPAETDPTAGGSLPPAYSTQLTG
jgi:Flp pilus assembly protein TadG